ncbi:hypothetical protein OH76DRAFT_825084 [Lentinus brumalis]|uniref:Uncharacterized protein n=1 Tax=Lentinus brumalis TaxID=2498619 RepID=A0A371D2A0_9APHY|nr:hypothetical protein OH76DRAFT_825084 [Polyporus brumalis]
MGCWRSCICALLTTSSLFPLVLAGTATADDTDAGMVYSGLWVPDGDPNTFGHHDTWTNQSGASVGFDFIGTQIQVFATRRPAGTYLTNVSFSIDGGPPTQWVTSDFVPEITYQNLVYTSPSLPATQHYIIITNFGEIFWLDYVMFTTADSLPGGGGGGGGVSSSTSTSTFTSITSSKVLPTSSSESLRSSAHSATVNSQSDATTNTSSSSSTTEPSTTPTSSSSAVSAGSDSISTDGAPLSVTPTQSSTDGGTGTALAVPANASSGSSSHTPIIIGVVVGVVGLIALLLATLWWLRMRSRPREQSVPEMSFASAPELGLPTSHSSKDRSALSSPQTPHSGVPLLVAGDVRNADSASPADPAGHVAASEANVLLHPEKLRQDEGSSARVSGLSSSLSSSVPGAQRPVPSAPEPRTSSTSALLNGTADGLRSSFADSSASGSYATTSGASQGPTVRMVRYSRDAGIRLAGGPLREADSQEWTPVEFDEVETLPPSYAHIHGR